jgi:glycosyltransferase involved in cell wall biosynthesis
MRICVLSGNYTRAGETFVHEPLEWLAAAGHAVSLVARRARELPEEARRRMPDRVLGDPPSAAALLRALVRAPLTTAANLARGWPHRHARGFELAQGLRAAALPELREADALYAHFGPTGMQFLSAAVLARRPYAVYFHGYDVGRVLAEAPRAYETLFRSGASLLTNCDFQRRRIVAVGAPAERVRIVPLGVDPHVTSAGHAPSDPPRVVTLARLVPKKGLDDSLRAFARLGTATEWGYDVVGDGPLRDALARLAAEEKIAERVRFHGFLARETALRVLRGASVFALASRSDEDGSTEGTPVALLEAAALGIPIVATRHAGIPEILPAQAASEGFLVAEGDVAGFGDALGRLARDASLRAEWGHACAEHVRARHSAAAHVEALTDALARHARVPEIGRPRVPQLGARTAARTADAAPRRLRIAVVANEFFDHAGGGRVGGFGWAAATVARCFLDDPALGADVYFLSGARGAQDGEEARVHDTPLLLQTDDYAARIRALAPDLLLLIDYRRAYRRALDAAPATPFILWSRDPWDDGDREKLRTLRIPGSADEVPSGYGRGDHTTFREVAQEARRRQRRWLVATTTPFLAAKAEQAYGVAPPRVHALPNPLPVGVAPQRAERPTVLWLGRLDAVKRPWLCVEIARRMPEVEFQVLGDAYVDGPLRWQPTDLPPNVKLRGHLEGAQKDDALARAWLLLSTAIHEGLAVSFLEALAAEMPIVACQDPEGLVSRFGRCVGRFDGSGMQAVPAFVESVAALLADTAERQRLGRAGREWVAAHHSRERFLEAFRGLAPELGVAWPGR